MEGSCINLVFSDGEYIRDGHPNQWKLEKKICKLYNVKNAIIAPSGLSAISCVLQGFINEYPEGIIWHSNELYYETQRLIDSLNCNKYACNDIIEIDSEINQDILVLFESCSNPSGKIPSFNHIKQLKEKYNNIYIVIDNTWLTSKIFNPFEFDVDIVVNSLTKYYSGGKAICGIILSDISFLFIKATDYLYNNGLHTSPYNCKIILDNIDELEKRIAYTSQITKDVIKWANNNNYKIYHPLIDNYEFVDKHFKNGLIPSIISFKVHNNLNIIEKTSYGGSDTRIEKHGEYLRLSVGYEDELINVISKLQNNLIDNMNDKK